MKAISFAAPIPTYLGTLIAGKINDALYVGPHACTRLADVETPALPTDRWVRVRTRMGGICGSDLNVVTLKASPSTSPFSSFPFVIGHENVGEIVEVGPAARGLSVGDRVVANPLLCCEPRGLEPLCRACAEGQHSRCERFTDGPLAPGMLIGTTRGLGGSWGEMFVAHDTQIVRVAETVSDEEAVLVEPFACSVHAVRSAMPASGERTVSDEEAVLVEPFACSVHAVRSAMPASGERVLVIGAGSIGLLTVAALKALAPESQVTALARHAFQAEHATRLGADRVVFARGDYLKPLAEAAQTRLLKPIIGKPVGVGGFDRTFICIGGARATEDAMRVTRAGGTLILLGNSAKMDGVDWTPLWLKELIVRGSLCYGSHRHASPARDAFREAAELIATRRVAVAPLLTHVYPLADYRDALATAMDKKASGSIKVAFKF
ncbi:MAG TPA: zinc-binding dehydrogenase [Gemmatimonadaceae bacterium]|nr:zinc-binding dehydrogenase [Gemmatimonadaceae bacterium]